MPEQLLRRLPLLLVASLRSASGSTNRSSRGRSTAEQKQPQVTTGSVRRAASLRLTKKVLAINGEAATARLQRIAGVLQASDRMMHRKLQVIRLVMRKGIK